MILTLPFSSKDLPDGRKLFRRKHGYQTTLVANGNTTLIISVPYNVCKINEADFIWVPEGIKCDFRVLDTPTGTLSTIPNMLLNQFGFDVNIAEGSFSDISAYDADLIKDMQLEIIIKNSTSSTKTIGINIVFHEVK